MKTCTCKSCGNDFETAGAYAYACSAPCAKALKTIRDYAHLHNNPSNYFKKLLVRKGREALSVEFLLEMLEKQEGICAISGQTLTFIKKPGSGVVYTNASIDQIEAGGGYTEDNVQLVCHIVNLMKSTMSEEELTFWCRAIVEG